MSASSVLLPPGGSRILVVQAHPDDADHLCGGTVARLIEEGCSVHYLLVTRGDKGSDEPGMTPEKLATIREREQCQAAETHGVQAITFLDGYFDGEVEPSMKLRREIVAVIRQWKPDVVFTFDPWRKDEAHPDHRAVGTVTLDALAASRGSMYFPEQLQNGIIAHNARHIYYYATDRPNHWVDISTVVEKKVAALRCHESQTKHKDLSVWVQEKGLVAGVEHRLKCAESFHYHLL